MIAVVAVVVIAVIAGIAYAAWRVEQRRVAAVQTMCAARGWRYLPEADHLVGELRDRFPVFRAGDHSRRIRHLVDVPGPIPVRVFDYSYVTESTDGEGRRSSSTHRRKLALAALPAHLPEVRVRTEGVLRKLGRAVGIRDQEVGSADFDKRFLVDGDPRAVHDLLHPTAVEWLLAQPVDDFELDGAALLVEFGNGRWTPPDEHWHAATHLVAFVGLVPDYVWRAAGVEPPPIP